MVIGSMKDFPYKVKSDGSCEMLGDDNKCIVYDKRPDCCVISKVYENNLRHVMTRKEFYRRNSIICNTWMDEDKVDESFRIDMSQYDKT